MNATVHEWTDEEKRDLLDECYPEVTIGNLTFSASRIIEKLDPVAFDMTMDGMDDKWECGFCGAIYDSEEEADECCREDEEEEE